MSTSRKQTLSIFFLCLFGGVSLFLLTPVDLYLHNIGDFDFFIQDILLWFIALAIVVTAVLFGVFLLLRKGNRTLFTALFLLMAGLFFAAYVQGSFLNIGKGALDNADHVIWNQQLIPMAKNLLIWIGILLVPLLLYAFLKDKAFTVLGILSFIFLSMQLVGVVSTFIQTPIDKVTIVPSDQDEFVLSKNNNIIYFVSDSFGTEFFDEIAEKDPQALDFLEGFTYYPNMVAAYRKTHGSMTHLINGTYYLNQEPFGVHIDEASKADPFWRELNHLGYQNRMTATGSTLFSSHHMETMENLVQTDAYKIHNKPGMVYYLLKLTAYRVTPTLFNPFLFDDFVSAVQKLTYLDTDNLNICTSWDPDFYQKLLKEGITAQREDNQLVLYYLNGPHSPLRFNRQVKVVGEENTTYYEQALGSLRVMEQVLTEMKALGIYEDATIIITADHASERGGIEITTPVSPILLLKTSGATGELTVSNAPVAHEDIRPTIIKAAGGNYESYGTPIELWQEEDSRVRKHYRYYWSAFPTYNTYLLDLVEYDVIGDAQNPDNYQKTGVVYGPKGKVNQ
ncbi:MAG: sulfatase-like hydrolase/transferase [Clostridiales bacterium]|nr:sulfatase-like hydrolase/transferase [Clostridiales bacterium]